MSRNEIIDDKEFLEEAKREVDVTWSDEDTEKKISGYIEDGVEVLQEDVGTSIDFYEDILAKSLLKTYIRYAWNKSEEYFIQNNIERILKLEGKYGKAKLRESE